MGTTTVYLEDGTPVDFPDNMSAGDIQAQLDAAHGVPKAAPAQSNALNDWGGWLASKIPGMAEAAGTGLEKGAAMLAGLPGDVENLAKTGASAAADYVAPGLTQALEAPEEYTKGGLAQTFGDPRNTHLPTSEQVIQTAKDAGVPMHEPQNKGEEYAQTIGEFLPGAVLNPEGTFASNALRYGVAPAAASQAAGDIPGIKGSWAETPARMAAGMMAPSVATRAISPNAGAITDLAEQQAQTLRDRGVQVTAGDITSDASQNGSLRKAEGDLNPGLRTQQAEQFTNAATSQLGMPPGRVTIGEKGNLPDVRAQIGQAYDDLESRHQFFPDPQTFMDTHSAMNDMTAVPGAVPQEIINRAQQGVEHVLDSLNNGVVPGKEFHDLRSNYGNQARTLSESSDPYDRALGQVYHNLNDALGSGMERFLTQIQSPDAGAYAQLGDQYKRLLTIENARVRQGVVPANGLITPQSLQSAAKKVYGERNYTNGNNPFTDLAEAGAARLTPERDSGTAGHQAINDTIDRLSRAVGSTAGGLIGSHFGPAGGEAAVYGLLQGENAGAAVLNPLVRAGVRAATTSAPAQWRLGNRWMAPNDSDMMMRALAGVHPLQITVHPNDWRRALAGSPQATANGK